MRTGQSACLCTSDCTAHKCDIDVMRLSTVCSFGSGLWELVSVTNRNPALHWNSSHFYMYLVTEVQNAMCCMCVCTFIFPFLCFSKSKSLTKKNIKPSALVEMENLKCRKNKNFIKRKR